MTSNAQLGQGGPAILPNASNKILWHYLDIWHLIHLSLPSNIVLIVQLNWTGHITATAWWSDYEIEWDGRVNKNHMDKIGADNQTSVDHVSFRRIQRGTFRYSESEFRIDWSELLSLAGTIVALLGSLTLKTIMFNADSN